MDPAVVCPSMSLLQLLEKQASEIERVLDLNRAIAHSLSSGRAPLENLDANHFKPERGPQVVEGGLEQPLLAIPFNDAKAEPSGETAGHWRTAVIAHMFPQSDAIKQHVEKVVDLSTAPSAVVYIPDENKVFWQRLGKTPMFQTVSLVMISLNVIWMGIDTDLNRAPILCEAPIIFQVVDNIFCTFFCFELAVNLLAKSRKMDALRDGWFLFDFILVFSMAWETWIEVLLFIFVEGKLRYHSLRQASMLRIFRMARFIRVFRTARWVRKFPELLILVTGMAAAMRSVVSVLGMLLLIVYLFAVMFTLLLSDTGFAVFDTVPQAANFLLCQTLCGFDASFILKMLEASWIYYILFLVYLFLSSLTLMNMLIGVLVQGVTEVGDTEKAELFSREVQKYIKNLARLLDADTDGKISSKEFKKVLDDVGILLHLNDLGVDVAALGEFGQFIFRECDALTFSEFEQIVLKFRKSTEVSSKDILTMQKYISQQLGAMEKRLREIPRSQIP